MLSSVASKLLSFPTLLFSNYVASSSSSNIYVRFLANDCDKTLHRLVVVVVVRVFFILRGK